MLKKLLFLFLTVILISCGKQEVKTEQSEETNTTQNKVEAKLDELMILNDNEMLVAVVKTNMGTMELELYAKEVPVTVKNFVGLALQNYYDGVTFHRVIDQFMVQGGDPTGSGRGGQSYYGHNFEDEFNPSLLHDKPGVLSMANAGPNTNGSQFFITLVPTPWLNGKHSVFGHIIGGMDVLESIGKVQTTKPFDKPVNDVVMESVTIEKREKK